ncbi:hypothetical protein C9374_008826 [Naegleria lovaniensis]|uniref:Uncharacterized protein n=1 Tax=Naegleria lovaniensis TaxID=51637 RepID=A0AA88KH25_NAELO|nr:uncharacterized protein C9374_008826 [Naegleria lovaniensis]KAG2377741.1 hypothetical protein C9374_008826 [Naegleria lovaniensis]
MVSFKCHFAYSTVLTSPFPHEKQAFPVPSSVLVHEHQVDPNCADMLLLNCTKLEIKEMLEQATSSILAPSWKLFISILLRLVMTCFIIGEFVPLPISNNNYIKTLYLFIAWGVSFQFDIRVYELCFCMCVNVLFIALNYNALSKGIFQFTSQDFLLQPVWEFFMWGFYVLHAMRSLGDYSCSSVRPKKREILIIGFFKCFWNF